MSGKSKSKSKSKCKNPNHKLHVADFIKKYLTAKGRVPQTIILVDSKDWSVALEHPALNTTECCWVCSIAEDIARVEKRIATTGLGQVCSCQWKDRVQLVDAAVVDDNSISFELMPELAVTS